MRKTKNLQLIGIALIIVLLILTVSGCVNDEDNRERYGFITGKEVVKVKDIYVNSDKFLSQTIKLEGKIIRECSSGCWFYLEDDTGVIFVDINPSGLSIPPKVGEKATVEGNPEKRNGKIIIVGKGVEF